MSKPDVDAVLDTVKEFDRIGRSAFMDKYGFADRNITYEVEIGSTRYPSKAIYGAALARMPGEAARTSETCQGTEARQHLARLGLKIIGGSLSDTLPPQSQSQADRIREFAIRHYVEPARNKGEASIEIVSGDVHGAMGLQNKMPAVCAVFEGKAFAQQAKVSLLDRHSPIGSDKPSSTIRYRFALDSAGPFDSKRALEIVEQMARRGEVERISPPERTTKAILFKFPNGRNFAVEINDNESRKFARQCKIVMEQRPAGSEVDWHGARSIPDTEISDRQYQSSAYKTSDAVRLAPGKQMSAIVGSEAALRAVLRHYGQSALTVDRAALERLKQAFLSLHPDFTNFADTPSFASNEGDYKQALIDEAQRLLAAMQGRPDAELGAALIELLAGRTQLFCNLIDWHAMGVIDKAREAIPGVIDAAAGKLARAGDATGAIADFVENAWPLLRGDPPINPYAESRMLPTMLRALVDPQSVLAIRSTPTDNAARALLGRPAFANAPLSREEQQTVTVMAREMMRVMDEEWGWAPRHLWDVQGFIWETCQKRLPDQTEPAIEEQPASEKANPAMPQPTNLILYGPPGTGKTYRTAAEAVRLCGEAVPDDREELMELYRSLSRKGRIGFVTFHQNFRYDFVEGLRPQQAETDEQGDGGGTGFSLVPRDGVFKEMAKVAGENRGRALTQDLPPFDGSRKIFKMSLGRSWASEDDAIYQGALDGGYVVLGWGGDVDWSSSEYDDWEAIKRRWRQDHPDAHGNDPNMSQIYTFRANMEVGSLIVISDGNMKFRAIAEVTGDYRFEPGPGGEYNHRRDVRWLWHSDESLPRERIYRKQLSQVSAYQMQTRQVVWDALEQIVASGGDAVATSGEPEPYVLVIDEINRANVSKVFGELITLLEPDKRAGQENALSVKLPYSGDNFSVPSNLHIIGTMNTADRSIALLDTALRRRFRFEEMAPDTSVEAFRQAEADAGLPLAAVLNTMNRRIEYLVDRDHRIGHAFFIGCESKAQIDAVMRDKVIPLLQEYFFDDWNRLAAVLGEKDRGGNFLTCETIEDPMGESGEPLKSWRVRAEFDEGAYARL
ncbi:MAG: AAA family ATPase, partial [Alteraurantiacibacter sp. bin_em_oilr2.035]|nr:AAA family ATPase [Alteraurantiacibacter sp. bin_em_oilr2.035]